MAPENADVRSALIPHLGSRVDMVAKIADFKAIDGHPPFFALLRDVRFQNGQAATDHLWTPWNGALFKARVGVGDEIMISARVIEYHRRDGSVDYGIDDLKNVRPALTLQNGMDIGLLATASRTLAARTAQGEVAIRHGDEPRLQAAMLTRFDRDPDKYGREIRVEFGPAVALFMLTNSARALGLTLEDYAGTLAGDGCGKALLGRHVQNLERLGRDQPIIVKLQAVGDREVQCQREAEQRLKAGENPLTPGDDDEAVYHKLFWLRSSPDHMALLLNSKVAVSIFPAGVIGATAAWNNGRHPDARGQIGHILRLTNPLDEAVRKNLAGGLTQVFANWVRLQRRTLRRAMHAK